MLPTTRKDVAVAAEAARPSVRLFGVDITHWPPMTQFLALCAAVFVCYCGYGYMQELIFRTPGMKPFGWYLTLVQFAIYALLGTAEAQVSGGLARRIPLFVYLQIALLTVATMGLSNASVGYLNYPTQVIFKCCKLIPVLIGGILIQGKRFNRYDVGAALVMSIGLALFTLADNSVSPNFDARGYVMICGALVADAIIGNVQEKAMKQHKASNTEVVVYSYAIGFAYILVGITASGELVEGARFFGDHKYHTYGYAAIFSLLGYAGVNVVLTLVRTHGALIAVTVTTTRKAFTIVLSFVFFSKPFTLNYLWAAALVAAGIYLNVYSKNAANIDALLLKARKRLLNLMHGAQPQKRKRSFYV